MDDKRTEEFITEEQARTVKGMFQRFLKSYKEKDPSMSDEAWLEQLFQTELPDLTPEQRREDARAIVESIHTFDANLESVTEATTRGVSKESWLADKIQETSVGMAVHEYGRRLEDLGRILAVRNEELAQGITVSVDGDLRQISRNPNLDGILAEHMIAETTQVSGLVQGKNIGVYVRNSHVANSVDVRAVNYDTGEYQNYQLKFGKDAKATISLIEGGNYDNQRIVVPSDQLDEVQAHFRAKGSSKTITDHIEAWGAEGKSFTKADMKQLQVEAQEQGAMPQLDYSHFQTRDLAMFIGKNAGTMAIQAAAVTTGLNIVHKVCSGERIDPDEVVETAIRTGADTSVKVVAAGTLQVVIRKGIITFLPRMLSSTAIGNIACVGIENIKVLIKVAKGELSVTKGLDQMGRVTTSMFAGLWGMTKGMAIGASLVSWIPVVGLPLAVVTGFIGGMVGYFGGSKLGETVYNGAKKLFNAAKTVGKSAMEGLRSAGRKISGALKRGTVSVGTLAGKAVRAVRRIFR